MRISSLVITLRRSTARAEQVRKIVAGCPVHCDTWDATDGSLLTADEIEAVYNPNLHFPRYPFELTRGEIGCFLSHRRIWQTMVEKNIPKLLVLEDDVEFLPNFSETLRFAVENIPDNAYVQFQVRELQPDRSEKNSPAIKNHFVLPAVIPLRTSAQLVTLSAARRLMEFSEKFDRPVDAAIQLKWIHGVTVLTSQPRSLVEVSGLIGGSTIGATKKGKPLTLRLQREIARVIYRTKIRYHSRMNAGANQFKSGASDKSSQTTLPFENIAQRDVA
jgi:glycosyl transferase family 25